MRMACWTAVLPAVRPLRTAPWALAIGTACIQRPFCATSRAREAPKVHATLPEEKAEQAKPKPISRFWKNVRVAYTSKKSGNKDAQRVGDHFVVELDQRSLRTPSGAVLRVPADRPLLACLVAQEWDEQQATLRPHSLPMTSLVARAIDGLTAPSDRAGVESYLLKYFDTDATCFHEADPDTLVQLQEQRWKPLVEWARERFGADIRTTQGLGSVQTAEAREQMGKLMQPMSPMDLAAFERAVMSSKSFVISLALLEGHIDAEQAALAAEVEVASQASHWGAVEDSHDVEHADLRRQLAGVACAQVKSDEGEVARFVQRLDEINAHSMKA